jgi:hypothetical protein
MTKDEALKMALEALELEEMACRYEKEPTPEHIAKAIAAIKEALAQPEQEPVGEVINERGEVDWISFVPLVGSNLYTTPPQRPWVGLTEERIKDIWLKGKDHGDDWLDVLALARSFEAELKEKNT